MIHNRITLMSRLTNGYIIYQWVIIMVTNKLLTSCFSNIEHLLFLNKYMDDHQFFPSYFSKYHMDVGQNGRPRGPQMLV